jgi:hypothetical protein
MKHETNKNKADFKKKTKDGIESWKKRKLIYKSL